MERCINYLKAVVIVHGKSEKQICEYIKNNLRLKIEIHSEQKGGSSIQIRTSLMKHLNNRIFKSKEEFLRKYDDIEIIRNKISKDFKIFIIMDTDDCNEVEKNNYVNKEMFKDHWAYDYIYPIYNINNLEEVLTKAKIPYESTGKNRKKEYIKIFPTDKKYIKSDTIQVQELIDKLKKIPETNMDKFLEFCLDNSK